MSIETQIAQANAHWEAWNSLGFAERIRLLEQALTACDKETQSLVHWQLNQISQHLAATQVLQGATGESNTLTCLGRGLFYCAVQDGYPDTALAVQAFTALATGNTVILLAAQTPKWLEGLYQASIPKAVIQTTSVALDTALQATGFAGIALCADEAEIIRVNRILAAKEGLLAQLVAETDPNLPTLASAQYANRFITERSISNNTTAVGGNATLLEMGAD